MPPSKIDILGANCTGCSYCVLGCPTEAISLQINQRAVPVIDSLICTECGECIYLCPNNVFSAPALEHPPLKVNDRYDAVVIGAGIGGLMTAAGLAKAGKKVLVLEQLSFIGGKYTHLLYHDYAISTAAWTCPGPNSRIGKLCTQLGTPIKWITIHDTKARGEHWIITKDGRRFTSTDQAQETLVGGPKGMVNVYRWIADMYDPGVRYPDDMTAREYIENFFPGNEEYIKYVETIITYCFASQTVDNFSANETKRAVVDAIEQMADWGTAKGGTATIVNGLEQVIHQNGGQIVTRTKVDRILTEKGLAVGVKLSDGREVYSSVVVHDAGIKRLIDLVGQEDLPTAYVNRLRNAVPAIVAALILGLKEPILGDDHSLLHAMNFDRTLNCYAPTFFDPKLAPPGHHALDVFWVMQPPYDLATELRLVKDQLRQIFTNFDQVVELQIPMFYQGGWTAEMAHRLGQSGTQRLNPVSPIKGLYLVGYDCIGYGMAGDIIPHGVRHVLHAILGDPQYIAEDEKTTVRIRWWLKAQLFRLMSLIQRYK